MEEFEFSLFSTPKLVQIDPKEQEQERSQLIPPDTADVGLPFAPTTVIQSRPKSYYFANYDDNERRQFADVAVTGNYVVEMSSRPYPALYLPHRVTKLPDISKSRKRNNPSKKRRLVLKQRFQSKQQKMNENLGKFKQGRLTNWKYYNDQKTGKPKLKQLH
ncbi:uncharacterized protein V1516DRAFT_681521 [Lipomyces oligophaga]|uniref:uncharacterized protein n=1 Tax=Lipomyces oligophaga TaxID=45792 RepID=UPI0034CE6247